MGGGWLLAVWFAAALSLGGSPPARTPFGFQSTDRAAEAAIRDTLQQYSTALAGLDAAAVKKVQPSIDLEGLKGAFKEMRALDVSIDEIKVLSSDTASARVSCRVTQTLTPKAGTKKTTAVTRVIRFRRQAGVWVIDAFER